MKEFKVNKLINSLIVAAGIVSLSATLTPTAQAASQNCVNGNKRASWDATWKGNDTITITPKKALCADTNVNFSSYVMPDNYNGKPFKNNATATPQTIFGYAGKVAAKGSTSPITMTIKLPESCKNIQIDAYWGQKVSNVGPKGHGTIIKAKIVKKVSDTCAPVTPTTPSVPVIPDTPEVPETPVTPVTPEAPVTPETPETPTELPSTGPTETVMQLIGATSLAGAATAYLRSRR